MAVAPEVIDRPHAFEFSTINRSIDAARSEVVSNVPINKSIMRKHILLILIAAAAFSNTALRADDIQFTTLPQPVQTTVIRETHIPVHAGFVRVIHDSNGVYAVTVRGGTGEQVVYSG